MFIIGDIAGQFGALCRLVERAPEGEEIICLGDLIDRGPYSPEVVEYCIRNKFTCLMGNHEDMCVDYYEETRRYDSGLWLYNGGNKTRDAYHNRDIDPMPHVAWMKTLSPFVIRDNWFISHAPIPSNMRPEQPEALDQLMWNREYPGSIVKGHVGWRQIFGHNSHWGLKQFTFNAVEDMNFYALCIDTSQDKVLTAYCTTNNKLYQEAYDPYVPAKSEIELTLEAFDKMEEEKKNEGKR
jgi:hypothetical protein